MMRKKRDDTGLRRVGKFMGWYEGLILGQECRIKGDEEVDYGKGRKGRNIHYTVEV